MARFEVDNDHIDWARYTMDPAEQARIVSPLKLREAINNLSTGKGATEGLRLPFPSAHHDVRFQPGKVSVWTGKSHDGKTTILKQLMLHNAFSGGVSAIASMEETPEEVLLDMCRMASHEECPDPDWVDVFCAWAEGKIHVYDQRNLVDPKRLLGVMNYCATELKATQFVIDSWMRMDIDDKDFNWHKQFINLLGMHATNVGIHAHLVVHLTKGDSKTRGDGPRDYEDMRGSGDVLNQADKIFNVWRNRKSPIDRPGGVGGNTPDGLLICEKQRGRPNWIGKINLWMDRKSGQFKDGKDKGAPVHFPFMTPVNRTPDIFEGRSVS